MAYWLAFRSPSFDYSSEFESLYAKGFFGFCIRGDSFCKGYGFKTGENVD